MTISSISTVIGNIILLLFLVGIPVYAFFKKVPVYNTFVEGAQEGFPVFLRIFPYMLAMLVAIGMLRASGAFDLLDHALAPFLHKMGIPFEIIPIMLVRPFSAGAAMGVLGDLLHTQGGNTFVAHLGAIVSNSADTTFYIAAIYFGAAAIRKTRHALLTSILVDMVAMFSAILFAHWLL